MRNNLPFSWRASTYISLGLMLGGSPVAMMQSTKMRDADHLALRWRFHFARHWRVPGKRLMWARFMIVAKVLSQDTSEVLFTKHNDVVKTLSADRPRKPLGVWIAAMVSEAR